MSSPSIPSPHGGRPIHPLHYQPAMERAEAGERETAMELVRIMRTILDATYADYGHAVRSAHAKSHALLQGTLTVPALAPSLAQGLFAKPARYPVVMRLSTNPGDVLPDQVSAPRGLAVKVVGVEGERLPGSEGDATQDFVLVNGPAFLAPDAKTFLGNLKLLAATTDKGTGAKVALSAALRGAESALEAVGLESTKLKSLGGHPMTHPLGETYFSQVPILFGPYMAKVQVAPVAPALTALKDQPIDLRGDPDGLRRLLGAFFAGQGGAWEVRVQLCTSLETMPIEDASRAWPEAESPYVTVARIEVEAQPAWTPARAEAVDDGLAFSPWHGLAAHRPLGSIMRVRKAAYEMSADFRGAHNRCPVHEPRTLESLPA